jgi:hypothetical protein
LSPAVAIRPFHTSWGDISGGPVKTQGAATAGGCGLRIRALLSGLRSVADLTRKHGLAGLPAERSLIDSSPPETYKRCMGIRLDEMMHDSGKIDERLLEAVPGISTATQSNGGIPIMGASGTCTSHAN